jgi:hypothetical protein
LQAPGFLADFAGPHRVLMVMARSSRVGRPRWAAQDSIAMRGLLFEDFSKEIHPAL